MSIFFTVVSHFLRFTLLFMLLNSSVAIAMSCDEIFRNDILQSSDTEQSSVQRLFSNPILLKEAEWFFTDGILSHDKNLATNFIGKLHDLLKNPKIKDFELYDSLREWLAIHKDRHLNSQDRDNIDRIEHRVYQLQNIFSIPPNRFLDVGAGDGKIAYALAKKWNLPSQDAMVLEVAQYNREPGLTWLHYTLEGKIPIRDGQIDAITVLMVLHHVENPLNLLNEVYRILSARGTVVVRETDASDANSHLLNKVLDEMFYAVFAPNPSVPTPAHYNSKERWKQIFEQVGFNVQTLPSNEPNNPFSPIFFKLTK